ncbi:uncharacterized protein RJT20DRAFT_135179 [Scheffersomyces xylosifermentans]|uniref:uncharacterized protein n=1 Tax=Scheffersomyces xylosifermentans TaxID=1304137 RepID=UPI00315DAC57
MLPLRCNSRIVLRSVSSSTRSPLKSSWNITRNPSYRPFPVLSRNLVRRNESNCSSHSYKQEYEKQKYDQLLRESIIQSTIANGSKVGNGSTGIKDNRRLSLRTIFILIATSSTLSMALYVVIQLVKFNEEDSNESISRKHIFLPLWLNSNLLYQKTFSFPGGLNYLDRDYAAYLQTEMAQLNKSSKSDLNNYLEILEKDNIKFTILEQVSSNIRVKKIFGLPLTVNCLEDSKFQIWLETKYPSISGIEIDIEKSKVEDKRTSYNAFWTVKSINISSIINGILIQVGLKLDHLDTEAQMKSRDRSRGSIHEVPIVDMKDNSIVNKNRDYNVVFTGEFVIKDKNQFEEGILRYKGTFDFDHLMINRGVKIQSMDLIMRHKSKPSEVVKYKLM